MNVKIKNEGTDNNQSVRLIDLSASGISKYCILIHIFQESSNTSRTSPEK